MGRQQGALPTRSAEARYVCAAAGLKTATRKGASQPNEALPLGIAPSAYIDWQHCVRTTRACLTYNIATDVSMAISET